MTPEQEKIHQEKVALLEKKKGKMKEVYILLAVATVIFMIGLISFGVLMYSM